MTEYGGSRVNGRLELSNIYQTYRVSWIIKMISAHYIYTNLASYWDSYISSVIWEYPHQGNAVGRYLAGEIVGERAQVFLAPEIADPAFAGDIEIREIDGDVLRIEGVHIEQPDGE